MTDAQLGPEEDSELRRLHVLKGFGVVAGSVTSRYDALRRRDRRRSVREPEESSVATPINKSPWGEVKPPPAKPTAAGKPAEQAARPAAAPSPAAAAGSAPASTPGSTAGGARVVIPAQRRRGLFRR